MRKIAKQIKEIDSIIGFGEVKSLGSKENADRLNEARRNLINILFSNGYELEYKTFKVIKSTNKRDLI